MKSVGILGALGMVFISFSCDIGIGIDRAETRNANEITQYGITWRFDREYLTGQFANGDYWVVGPVTIVGISPGSSVLPGGRDLSPANPLTIRQPASLVTGVSYTDHPANEPNQVHLMAVLTVLDAVPPAGAFRPPYTGTDKTIRHTEGELRYDLLKTLPVPAGVTDVPDIATTSAKFRKVWPDHMLGYYKERFLPHDNMQSYGREVVYAAADIGTAEYGIMHAQKPRFDNAHWESSYRWVNSIAWSGFILASRVMGIQDLYNHPALFDYVDKWMQAGYPGQSRAYGPFQDAMWTALRPSY